MEFDNPIETDRQDLTVKEDIESLKQELERKKAELENETKFYRDARSNPRKSFEDESVLEMIQDTRKKLGKEIEELEERIEKA